MLFAIMGLLTLARPALAAERLHLAPALVERIGALCPDCVTTGVIACGDADVLTGPKYYKHAFLGTPRRAYLMSWPMGDEDMRQLSQTLPHDAAQAAIADRFRAVTLLAIEADGAVRSLGSPTAEVLLPEKLHACLADPAKPWGCCVAGCGQEECCEKSLGSHRISLRWPDDGAERLSFRWSRNGSSMLLRRADGVPKTDYFCLVWNALRLD
ncbi:hypothetical protein [Oleomonas cavernae]|nr:hypothetical protein [Oleomonas cavernae]